MLTIRENLLETIRGGNPDRYVNQYEYLELIMDPIVSSSLLSVVPGEPPVKTNWGYWYVFPEGAPGPMPVHDEDKIVITDVTKWRDVVSPPDPHSFTDEDWAPAIAQAAAVDRSQKFVASFIAPGLFEKVHNHMSLDKALMAFVTNKKEMHELVEFFADWEIECAKVIIDRLHPDAIFHHDDWGSQSRTLMSPKMFKAFFEAPYKRVYSFWKDNGVELIVHHNDSYSATLVPSMVEMGIDIWQGAVSDNDLPALVKEFGGKISFHGGFDNGKFDVADLDEKKLYETADALLQATGKHYIIPGMTMGGPESTYPGVFETATKIINELSAKNF